MIRNRIVILLIFMAAIGGCASRQTAPCPTSDARHEELRPATEADIAALFDRWNEALQTGDPGRVVALYAEGSILLPTLSDKPRLTPSEKEEYFRHFLEKRPFGRIDMRKIEICGDMAVDSGLYTFTFAKTGEVVSARYSFAYRRDGSRWLIVSHHSSAMPESSSK